jgi:hypothetical protein
MFIDSGLRRNDGRLARPLIPVEIGESGPEILLLSKIFVDIPSKSLFLGSKSVKQTKYYPICSFYVL